MFIELSILSRLYRLTVEQRWEGAKALLAIEICYPMTLQGLGEFGSIPLLCVEKQKFVLEGKGVS